MTNQIQKFMPVKEAIIFDIETTDTTLCNRYSLPQEIWNIGAVRVNRFCEILETFDVLCKVEHPELMSPCCRWYTKHDLDVNSGSSFEEGYKKFCIFVGRSNLMSWGSTDYDIMKRLVAFKKLSWEPPHLCFDGLSFAAGLLSNYPIQIKSYGLKNMCEHFCIDSSPDHTGLQDSICTAKLINHLLKIA